MAVVSPPPFEPERFRSAAEFYERGRAAYSPSLVARVADAIGLEPKHRLLDLGCGTGPLARAFAPRVQEVAAVDPSAEMLAVARNLAAGMANIDFRQASSYDLGPEFGVFRLVVMGRSFHWMDRVDTLRRLDQMIDGGGAIALFHDTAPKVVENSWRADWRAIVERYMTKTPAQRDPNWLRHEDLLLASAFSRLERFGVIEQRPLDVETLIQRTLSMSVTSPSHVGDRTQEMIEELRTALAGVRQEVVESTALIAWRP